MTRLSDIVTRAEQSLTSAEGMEQENAGVPTSDLRVLLDAARTEAVRNMWQSADMVERVGELDRFLTQPEATQAMSDAATKAVGHAGPWRVVWSAMMDASDIPSRLSETLDSSHHAELVEALNSALEMVLEASGSGNFSTEEFNRCNALLAKIGGDS